MSARNALLSLCLLILVVLGGIAVFNYTVDAACYYQCPVISKDKKTINTYYNMGQRVLNFPDSEILIIGSSRGETTPPLWIQKVTGKRTLNLSAAGAELATKKAILNIAIENAPIKKVIWLADYFELIDETKDAKIKNTPALQKYLDESVEEKSSLKRFLGTLQGLIDHNTTDASLRMLKKPPSMIPDQGTYYEIKFDECEKESYVGKESPESLKNKTNIIYESYLQKVIRLPQRPAAWEQFKKQIQFLTDKNIDVTIMVNPYHPDFLSRLKKEYPEIYQRHLLWITQLETLKSPQVHILNYFDGIAGDDGSNKYWNDGVHFTCHSAMKMLNATVSSWK